MCVYLVLQVMEKTFIALAQGHKCSNAIHLKEEQEQTTQAQDNLFYVWNEDNGYTFYKVKCILNNRVACTRIWTSPNFAESWGQLTQFPFDWSSIGCEKAVYITKDLVYVEKKDIDGKAVFINIGDENYVLSVGKVLLFDN